MGVLSNNFYNLNDYSIKCEKNNILLFILFPAHLLFHYKSDGCSGCAFPQYK